MPRKIIDEFSERTDLSSYQKWKLRHPERCRQIQKRWRDKRPRGLHASEMRVWRDTNPDAYEAAQKKYRKKLFLKKIAQTRDSIASDLLRHKSRPQSNYRRKEVLSLHGKGKSIADIVIATNIPFSIVTSIVQSEQNPTHT